MPKVRKTSLHSCKQLVQNQIEASLVLAGKVSDETLEKKKNLVFSPLSLNLAVGMVAAGVSGQTLEDLFMYLKQSSLVDINKLYSELVSVIFVDGSLVGGPKLAIANGVWIQKGLLLKDSFKQVVDNVYKASFHRADFIKDPKQARLRVNSWGDKQTNGLIRKVLPRKSIDEKTRLVLANALYFLDGKTIKVPFMRSYRNQLISTFHGFKVLGLRYEDGDDQRRFSMYIFLPDTRYGLSALTDRVWSEAGFLDRHLPSQFVPVGEFRLPKFKISFKCEASKTLKQLGLELLFKNRAITEMVNSPLKLKEIYHKSYIEVNEQGTEAAAITLAELDWEDCACEPPKPPPRVNFVADHPFMFVIREDVSEVVLFVGHVVNPLEH